MKAEIIAVGSELLTPDRVDTNSLYLTEELNKLGIEVVRKTIVGDNRELLAEAFRDALERVPPLAKISGTRSSASRIDGGGVSRRARARSADFGERRPGAHRS